VVVNVVVITMEKVSTIHHLNLNLDEIILACSIINRFGTGQHPYADSTNYHGFAISYLKERGSYGRWFLRV
jgi:hypothetical protein